MIQAKDEAEWVAMVVESFSGSVKYWDDSPLCETSVETCIRAGGMLDLAEIQLVELPTSLIDIKGATGVFLSDAVTHDDLGTGVECIGGELSAQVLEAHDRGWDALCETLDSLQQARARRYAGINGATVARRLAAACKEAYQERVQLRVRIILLGYVETLRLEFALDEGEDLPPVVAELKTLKTLTVALEACYSL